VRPASRDAINMTLAYVIARGSKDDRTKIGAVIIGPDHEIRSTGHNGYPRGLDDERPERQQKPEKDFWFEHAERNAIFNAVRIGVSLKGCTLYTQRTPCEACARAIVQAGIAKVVLHKPWCMDERDQHPRTRDMFAECGVDLVEWDGELLQPVGWRRGEKV
jgi:dCMP deaminase